MSPDRVTRGGPETPLDDAALVALPAAFAALVAIMGTLAVERFGGRLGGVLHTVPTTIVPASVGMWYAKHDARAFGAAMAAVPLGMLIDAAFLWTWRAIPRRLPAWPLGVRLGAMVALSLGVWFLGAFALVQLLASSESGDPRRLGAAGLAVTAGIGIGSCMYGHPAPKGSRRPAAWMIASRGVLAATAIAVCVWIAHHGQPVASGLASAFPAMFLTTMVSLWIAQGEAVPTGAVGPMILGSTSVGTYSLIASWALPSLGVWVGVPLAWVLAVACTSVPAGLWLTRQGGH